MQEDLDPDIDDIAPWNYSIKIGGDVYPTRCPCVGDVMIIESLDADDKRKASLTKVRNILDRVFLEPKPPIDSWSPNILLRVVNRIFTHLGTTLKKNSPSDPA